MKTVYKILSVILLFTPLQINAQYNVSTWAGTGTAGYADGPSSSAQFDGPFGMCRDAQGNLYIADAGNHCIRKIDPNGQVSTFAGSSTSGYMDGPADSARFNEPINICTDGQGNFYVSDFLNHRIRKIDAQGMVTTVAGSGVDGFQDGPDSIAQFNYPRGIAIDSSGNLFIADSWNHRIRKIDPNGNVTTYAGGGTSIGVSSAGDWVDAFDTTARFWTPSGLSIDIMTGYLYVADAFNHRIRLIYPGTNAVITVAGTSTPGPGNGGFADGMATASAELNTPTDCHVTSSGKILIGDTFNNRLRLLDGTNVSTLAGDGIPDLVNGADSIARLNFPRGIVTNSTEDSIWVVDHNNHAVRLLSMTSMSTGIDEIFDLSEIEDEFGILYNLQGQYIQEVKLEKGKLRFTDQPSGIYLLHLPDSQRTLSISVGR